MTILVPYYENKQMLLTQWQYWHRYPSEVAERLDLIIVDDGSQEFPAHKVLSNQGQPDFNSVQVFRIQGDKPWNHMGARNLGFFMADDEWVFSTDIGQVIPYDSMTNLLDMDLVRGHFYRPSRVHEGEDFKRHNDSYIINKADFWETGGYDEDFSGYYGGGSTLFYRQLKARFTEVLLDNRVHILHFKGLVEDSSTEKWGRQDSEYYYKNNPKILKLFKAKTKGIYKPENPIRFTWERVM